MNYILLQWRVGRQVIACSFFLSLNYRLLLICVENRKKYSVFFYLRLRGDLRIRGSKNPHRDLFFAGLGLILLRKPILSSILHKGDYAYRFFTYSSAFRKYLTNWYLMRPVIVLQDLSGLYTCLKKRKRLDIFNQTSVEKVSKPIKLNGIYIVWWLHVEITRYTAL